MCYNETYAKFRISETRPIDFLCRMVWNRGWFVAISFHSSGITRNYKSFVRVRRIEIERDTSAFLFRSFHRIAKSDFKLRHVYLHLVCPHVCELVRMQQFGSHWRDFYTI
jgi:hypothetical protein